MTTANDALAAIAEKSRAAGEVLVKKTKKAKGAIAGHAKTKQKADMEMLSRGLARLKEKGEAVPSGAKAVVDAKFAGLIAAMQKAAFMPGMPMLPGMGSTKPLQSALKMVKPSKPPQGDKKPKNMGTPQGRPKMPTPQMPPPQPTTPPSPPQGTMKSAEFAGVIGAMEKVSKEEKKKKKSRAGAAAAGAAGAIYAGGAAVGASAPVSAALAKSMKSHGKTSPAEIEKMKKHFGVKPKVHSADFRQARAVPHGGSTPSGIHGVERMGHRAMGGTDSHWHEAVKGHGAVYTPTTHSPELAAHELGHIALRKHPAARAALRHGRSYGHLVGTGLGGAMAVGGERGSKKVKAAPFVAAAGHLPKLVDEAAASVKGYRALKALGHSKKTLRHARGNLAKGFGSYAVQSAAHIAPVAAVSALKWKKKKKEGEE
jgi:hypothetical protein